MPSIANKILSALSDGKPRLLAELAKQIDANTDTVRHSCRKLVFNNLIINADGVVQIKSEASGQVYTTKGKMAVSNKRSLRARAWSVMRMRDWFSLDDLLLTLADGSELKPESNLMRYLRALKKAGYLINQKRDNKRYKLVKNTGQVAPSLNNSTRTLTDSNTFEVHRV